MMKSLTRGGLVAGLVCALALTLGLPARADAQYFGRNKVQYDKFKFQILTTEHFDIYYYPEEADAAKQVGRMAERWYARLSKLLGTGLMGRQPVILYASHPDFEQTNVIEGQLSEGTGGVTEGAKRRVIMPMAASLADTDHVLGHELVHAFQYDILGPNAEGLPLWFIEGWRSTSRSAGATRRPRCGCATRRSRIGCPTSRRSTTRATSRTASGTRSGRTSADATATPRSRRSC